MELNDKQQQGLELAVTRYKNNRPYTVISGYAGTGKSTLVKFIVSALKDIDPETDVVYTSFTGKATQVLQKKGNKNVSTLHRLLFESIPQPDGSFFRKPVKCIPYKLVIVDECSMVPKDLVDRLLSYKVHTIFLGDPAQLPPIDKNADNHLLDKPDIFLNEIMRQEEQSEIIKLTMNIRAGKSLTEFHGTEVQILNKSDLNTGMMQWADQIICATNTTRVALNNQMRELKGISGDPQPGDKIICLKNDWDIYSNSGNPLVNGTIGYIKNCYDTFINLPPNITCDGKFKKLNLLNVDFISDTQDDYGEISMDKQLFLTGELGLDYKTLYRMGRNWKFKNSIPNQFTYGYAITCHKSQGSEWDNVLVVEEDFPYDKEEHQRWLYTAATRAAKKLVIIKK